MVLDLPYHDPSQWLETAEELPGIVESVRELANGTSTPPDRCLGVGITGQWGSTVPVDGDGRALGVAGSADHHPHPQGSPEPLEGIGQGGLAGWLDHG